LSNIIGLPRISGDFIEVTFDMCINNELISRLFSYKSNCEVLEPEVLREKMKVEVIKMFNLYELK
jgi:predicted DNA-binding transcriptional regulator YafY